MRFPRVLFFAAITLPIPVTAQTARERARAESLATARYLQRVYREESKFFADWRYEWKKQRDLKHTDPRWWSLHCHYDDYHPDDALHVISNSLSKKSMCPIWFQHQGMRPDESVAIDNGIGVKSRPQIRAKRERLLAMLDTANRLAPGNWFTTTQRVRLLIDQGEYSRAVDVASKDCRHSPAGCLLLEGRALMAGGFRSAAEATFDQAIRRMNATERCGWLDIAFLISDDDKSAYNELSCAQRAEIDERFWWLSDPLFLKPGNDRLADHLDRQATLIMKSALTADEHFDYRPAYGGLAVAEMITRYGWPSLQAHDLIEDEAHNKWLGFKDSASNASREYFAPRYHVTPDYRVAVDPRRLTGKDLRNVSAPWLPRANSYDVNWWPLEHQQRAGALRGVDYHAVAFRRERGPVLAIATDLRGQIADSLRGEYTIGLVSMRHPRDSAIVATNPLEIKPAGSAISVLFGHPGQQVISNEIVNFARDSALALRARFSMLLPAGLNELPPDSLAISDIALFVAPPTGGAIPNQMPEVVDRLLPSTTLESPSRVGAFFELYGVAAADSIELSLTVTRADRPGLFRRFGSRVGLIDPGTGSFVVHWRDGDPSNSRSLATIGGVRVEGRSIVLNLQGLAPGNYALEIGASRKQGGIIARREFSVVR